jgi:natural product biosynthesis luciferase-like monooxygenase protein
VNRPAASLDRRDLQFSLMFFACTEEVLQRTGYRLVIESARFADREGFTAVWVPERHFTGFGYLYPSPAVLHAALARETQRVRLRAGSVVATLHHPLRIAEEWAMVDNLSGGRVDVSFAPGWNPNDFAFYPDRYPKRREHLYESVSAVQRLWRQEPAEFRNGTGEQVQLRIYPPPVQPELPVWITAAGSPETFVRAGRLGANILTHLLDHGVDEIAHRIRAYREARAAAGHDPEAGQVTIMLHTFVGANLDEVRELVRVPYCRWLASNVELLKGLATNRGTQIDVGALSQQDREQFANLLFERFFTSRALMGTPQSCLDLAGELQKVGVTEIACLLDFGPSEDLVLAHLPHLKQLKELYQAQGPLVPGALVAMPDPATAMAAASGVQRDDQRPRAAADRSVEEIKAQCEAVEVEEFYKMLCQFGVQLEGRFRGVKQLWRRDGEALGHVLGPGDVDAGGDADALHPAFLDACLQVFAATLPATATADEEVVYVPVGLGGFEMLQGAAREVWSHAVLTSTDHGDLFEGDIRLLDTTGRQFGLVSGFRLQRTARAGRAAGEDLASWLYEIAWVKREIAPSAARQEAARWLILADRAGVGEELAEALREHQGECLLAYAGANGRSERPGDQIVDPARPDEMRRLVGEALAGGPPVRGVVHLWSLDAAATDATSLEAIERDQAVAIGSALHLAQALASAGTQTAGAARRPRLWLVTRGAQAVPGAPRPLHPQQAAVWGFGKSYAAEHAELWGGLVDLDPDDSPRVCAAHLTARLRGADAEDQLSVRAGQFYAPRLTRRRETPRPNVTFRADGTYCVTGGLGGIGAEVARWLVRNGARHLVLLGRRMPRRREAWPEAAPDSPEAVQIATVRALEEAGAHVSYGAVDVADESQVAAFFDGHTPALPPIRGVFHAAGVGQGDTILKSDLGLVAEVLRPKVRGTWVLDRVLRGAALDFFVLFSSATHQLGVLGQGTAAYSSASAFLDAFAHYRRGLGRTALSIDWGPWSEVGMAAQSGNVARLQTFGIGPVSPRNGTEILGHAFAANVPQLWAISVDWERLLRTDASLAGHAFLTDVTADGASQGRNAEELAKAAALREEFRALPPQMRVRRLERHVQEQIASVMGLETPDDVDWRRGLFEIGMDSLMALELKNRLQLGLGVPIPSTLAFDHPTTDAIARFLAGEMFPAEAPAPAAVQPVAAVHLVPEVEREVALATEAVRGLNDREIEQLLERKLNSL